MRISGCSTAAIAIDSLREVSFRTSTDSDARPDTDSGFVLGASTTGCDSDLVSGFCKPNLGSSMLTGAKVLVVGLFVAAIAGEFVCAPRRNGSGMNTLGVNGPRSNATIASKVTHRTVKRVVGFSRGNSFRKSHIATARH